MFLVLLVIGIVLLLYMYTTTPGKSVPESNEIVINTSGTYELRPHHTYYFQLKKDDSYILTNLSTPVELKLPLEGKKGDTIVLIDTTSRYGWGNLTYTFTLLSKNSSVDLFLFRGGTVRAVWDSDINDWHIISHRGDPSDPLSGWYRLVYKGAGISKGFGSRMATAICSYMRIDATQNPILITFYGGSPTYPLNVVVGGISVTQDTQQSDLVFPEYPNFLSSTMNHSSCLFRQYKNGVIVDYLNGGGWRRDDKLQLFEIPPDMIDLNP